MNDSEIEKIKLRYDKRERSGLGRNYSMMSSHNLYFSQEKDRALVSFLNDRGIDVGSAKVLEIGCGGGANLLALLRLNFRPENLFGNDLLEDRIESANKLLPDLVNLYTGDASELNLESGSFDIVYVSTVFSSILDDALKRSVADKAWELVRPGGALLWYDFTFDNPSNPDVKGVSFKEIKTLFPQFSKVKKKRVTLAPPVARAACRISPALYSFLNLFPFLRTHLLVWLEK